MSNLLDEKNLPQIWDPFPDFDMLPAVRDHWHSRITTCYIGTHIIVPFRVLSRLVQLLVEMHLTDSLISSLHK